MYILLIPLYHIINDSLQGHDALTSCGKYPAEMTRVARVCTIDLYIYFEYVYIMHCCWFFWDYLFNDVRYVIIKGGEVRKWLFEDIYLYVIYITLLTFWFWLNNCIYIFLLCIYFWSFLNVGYTFNHCRVMRLCSVIEIILQMSHALQRWVDVIHIYLYRICIYRMNFWILWSYVYNWMAYYFVRGKR